MPKKYSYSCINQSPNKAMFKKKEKAVSEVDNPGEKFSRKVVQETVETSGGVQTTRTVITTSNSEDIESAFKNFNFGSENFRSGGTCVTKKVVYTSSGKQVTEETVESFEDQPKFGSDVVLGGAKSITKKTVESIDQGKAPSKCDAAKGGNKGNEAFKSGKSISEKMGLKSSKSPEKSPANGATTKAKTTAPSVKPGKFEDDALKSHNAYRAKHGVPPLKLSKEICAYSKEWADHLAATDSFKHRTERKYGENIFMKWSSDPNHMVAGNEAVESWYSEIKDHVFGREAYCSKSGHFTQVIWKKSAELGIAWSRSQSGKILVVANYNPAGNLLGTINENVPPPKK